MSMMLQDIRAWLVDRVAGQSGVVPGDIDVHENFIRYGLDSLGTARMVAELGLVLERQLSPTLAWEYPTIDGLAHHLAGEAPIGARFAAIPPPPSAQQEPLAIIGMACRLPKAPSKAAFWQLLRSGQDAIGEIPAERWRAADYYDPTPGAAGKINTTRGGFLDSIDQFDPLFFGISPHEASYIDPQQRLLLELSWEALEDAGIVPKSLVGSRTGVFVGVIWADYSALLHRDGAESISEYTVTGHQYSILANRISYCLGLQGPSMAIDSACSSSIVALQAGCESLRRGESTLVLVGGVNLMVDPESMVEVASLGALSPDGRCYSFDARANGYVRGEGGGVIALKRLSQALADGDSIYCLVRGYAVNNDGASNGLTAPNPAAQEALLRTAYQQSGIDLADVQYVEAHGTGTPLGDPIEAKALGAVFAPGRSAVEPLRIGSAKTNVGHLEGAAGIVGLIKAALCIKHRLLVPSLNYAQPNPHIPFAELRLQVQNELQPWPRMDRLLTAGISSFGLGGTNSHAVLQEWRLPQAELFALSAASSSSLVDKVQRLCEQLAEQESPTSLRQFCRAAAAENHNDSHRLALTARSHSDLERQLRRFSVATSGPAALAARAASERPPRVAFVFGGQGAQWWGMGQTLWQTQPLFRSTIEACSRHIEQQLGWSLVAELAAPREQSQLHKIEVSLPAIISIEIAVSALWRSFGIEPACVIGHSTGEIAAAHVAGVLSLEDAMRTICAYGRIIAKQRGRGVMGVVGLSLEQAAEALKEYEGRVFCAIAHSVDSTVVAGDPPALEALFDRLSAQGVYCRKVDMDVAPHCPLADELRPELLETLADVSPRRGTIPIVSEVTGAFTAGENFDAAHWVRNFGDQAFFSTGIDCLIAEGFDTFLEVSPHPLVQHAVEANLRHRRITGSVLSTMRRQDERGAMLDSLARLYSQGAAVQWQAVYPNPLQQSQVPVVPLLVSAKDEAALRAAAGRLADHLQRHPTLELPAVSFTLCSLRACFPHRAVVLADSLPQAVASLRALSQGAPDQHCVGADAPNEGAAVDSWSHRQDPMAQQVRSAAERVVRGPSPSPRVELGTAFGIKGYLVDLPSYPFQRQRYWLRTDSRPTLDAESLGLETLAHPLLGSATSRPDGAYMFTGRLDLEAQPYLRDHAVFGHVLLPGSAFVELALRAGQHVGAPELATVAIETPLQLAPGKALRLQVTMEPAQENGQRGFAIHSCAVDDQPEAPWLQHALGIVQPAARTASAASPKTAWPPEGAKAAELGGLYEELNRLGYDYGPSFRGLKRLYQRDETLYGEIELPENISGADYRLHPALLDAAMHTVAFRMLAEHAAILPFEFEGMTVYLPGARQLRVTTQLQKAAADGWEAKLTLHGRDGELVAEVERLRARPVSAELRREVAAATSEHLYCLRWLERPLPQQKLPLERWAVVGALEDSRRIMPQLAAAGVPAERYPTLSALTKAVATGAPKPRQVVRVMSAEQTGAPAAAAQQAAAELLTELQLLLQEDSLADSRFVLLTQGALALQPEEVPGGFWQAGLWGLLRSARAEYPTRRWMLLDVDAAPASKAALLPALAAQDEAEAALRGGIRYAPSLLQSVAPAAASKPEPSPDRGINPQGTVLITGGTRGLGAEVARHLARTHRQKHLILSSRQGPQTPRVEELAAELKALGCDAIIAACDVTDSQSVQQLIQQIDPEHPLSAVFHCAAVLDDGILTALTPARVAAVFAAKALGAWNLHQATLQLPLSAFVVFSSVAGLLGSAGQAAYAAANTFVDALCAFRHASGLPAKALAWGSWAELGMAAQLAAPLQQRIREQGIVPLPPSQAVALLDRSLWRREALLAPVALDKGALHKLALAGELSPLLGSLVGSRAKRAAEKGAPSGLVPQLQELAAKDRTPKLLEVVRKEVAALLHLPEVAALRPDQPLQQWGMDSMMAVKLRNRLEALLGLRLPATVLFDYPTVQALTKHILQDRLQLQDPPPAVQALEQEADPHAKAEPIAIVAMACRAPGGVLSPSQLWELLAHSRDAISAFPSDRGWDLASLFNPDPDSPGTTYARHGGFLPNIDLFDPAFFSISHREALSLDPQQRILLELSWETLENAGIPPASLAGTRTGVFIGAWSSAYAAPLFASPAALDGYVSTGNMPSTASGRIAYTLGLHGPALTIDTACSSSLVCLHLAARSLLSRESDYALAGGVTLMPSPSAFVEFSRLRGMAPDGRCKPFSQLADGVGWAEGAGLLLLMRLSDAKRLGHPVLAVIRGSAVNQDGRSQGLTAPNGPAQQNLIRDALSSAGLVAADIDAVEAHGTGTSLGDPIEAQALLATYGSDRSPLHPLLLGSLKSNIGHTQAAAGALGVIKLVLSLQHGLLPKTLHADSPSPHIDWSASGLQLLQNPRPWLPSARPRRAAISSFGISGTNAHLILEEAPPLPPPTDSASVSPSLSRVPLLLSGRDISALRSSAALLADYLHAHPSISLTDVSLTLSSRRSLLTHRAAVLAGTSEQAQASLRALSRGLADEHCIQSTAASERSVAFIFPGFGCFPLELTRSLYHQWPIFAACLDEISAALSPFTHWSLHDLLFADTAPEPDFFSRADVRQPAMFAFSVALARLWQSWGVTPAAVIGLSQGEIAAAFIAGALSLSDAAQVVSIRSSLIHRHLCTGSMATVGLPAALLQQRLAPYAGRLFISGIYSASFTSIAGQAQALTELLSQLHAEGVFTHQLAVGYASHCPYVDPVVPELTAALSGIVPQIPQLLMLSSVIGSPVQGPLLDADYWARNLRQPSQLHSALLSLKSRSPLACLELSPHPKLSAVVEEVLEEDGICIPSLSRALEGMASLLRAAATLTVRGQSLDWPSIMGTKGRLVQLPNYPFTRQRFWLQAPAAPPSGTAPATAADQSFWSAVEKGDAAALYRSLQLEDESLRAAVATLLPSLSSWHRRTDEERTLDTWRYRVTWVPQAAGTGPSLTGNWLLVSSREGEQDSLLETARRALRESGATIVPEVLAECDCDRAALTARLRQTIAAAGGLCGVLSVLALDEVPLGPHPELPRGLALTLTLAQSLADLALDAPLWLLTRGAVSIGSADPLLHPLQALTWGLGRVIALEHAASWGGLIDVSGQTDEISSERLAAALATREQEDQLALRPSGLFARRLVRAPLHHAAAASTFRPRETVLVTGGTGGIGAHLARWLAKNGAAHLVLTSRRGADAEGAAALEAELTALGVRVTLAACDVADRQAVAELLNRLAAQGPPLRAVIHAAGISRKSALSALSLAEFAEVAASKVAGALHLSQLLDPGSLDAFVLFSSVSGIWGSSHLGAYSAANAFLDALAEQRRSQGGTATAVAWGRWGDGGMGDAADHDYLQRLGLSAMAPGLAIAALQQTLAHDETTLVVADVDWPRFASSYASARSRPLLNELAEARPTAAAPGPPSSLPPELPNQFLSLAANERFPYLLSRVLTETSRVLGQADSSQIDPNTGFSTLGLDSLMALELRRRLQQSTGVPLPATLAFDHPSPHRVATFLLEQTAPAEPGEPAAVPPAAESAARVTDDDHAIAIIGMGLRLPGGAVDLDGFWRILAKAVDLVGPAPPHRGWSLDDLYDPDMEARSKSYVREAAFLSRIDLFDAAFFGISPREAVQLDPQHRLLLETAWQALEDAGIVPDALRDSQTGVFVGISQGDYGLLQRSGSEANAYAVTGQHASFAAGRLAFSLGLRGPALAVDTACSSSLVALHLACQSLRQGECELALCGGASLMAAAESFVLLSRLRAVAPDGRSKTFSARADGYGRGEGVVVLTLERLRDAQARGHRILAVISGSAINHDGASSGITAPNGTAQQKVLRAALKDARLSPTDVDVVECHGTGTALGDPIEVQALAAVYGQGRTAARPLRLGALKTQLGHLEAASGLAGVAKMVAALHHEALPATLHTTPRNLHLDWQNMPVQVIDAMHPWPRRGPGAVRRAGISAFGISGTNAHVLLEEAPSGSPEHQSTPVKQRPSWMPVLVSAKSEAALRAQATQLYTHLDTHRELALADVAGALATTRSHFDQRAVLLAGNSDELLSGLRALAQGHAAAHLMRGQAKTAGKLALLFSGQGSQYVGMGQALYRRFAPYREALDEICSHMDGQLDRPLRSVIFAAEGSPDAALLDQTAFTQPALFAQEVALFRLLSTWGLKPDLLLGHSIGELAAAHVAEVLSLADACTLVAKRAQLMQALDPGGAMVALQASEEEVREQLSEQQGLISLAANNGPLATVISGDAAAVQRVAQHFESLGRDTTRLRVSHAFHSPHMDGMLHAFQEVAASLHYQPPRIPIISNVTGVRATDKELLTADYWARQVRQTVRFYDGVRALADEGVTTFLDVGPRGILCAMAQDCLPEDGPVQRIFVPALRRDRMEEKALITALGRLHASGYELDWQAYFSPMETQRIKLPTYAFQPERFWPEVSPRGAAAAPQPPTGKYVLSGQRSELPDGSFLHTLAVGPGVQSYLQSHAAYDRLVVPGAFHVAVLLAVGESHWPHQPIELRDVQFLRPIAFDRPTDHTLLHIQLTPVTGSQSEFSVTAATQSDGDWTIHVTASLKALSPDELAPQIPLHRPAPEPPPIQRSALNDTLSSMHMGWGPMWWWIQSAAKLRARTCLGRLAPPPGVPLDDAPLPGGFIDNSFGLALWANMTPADDGSAAPQDEKQIPRLPFGIERVVFYGRQAAPCWAQNTLRAEVTPDSDTAVSDLIYWDADGSPVGHVDGITTYRAPMERFFQHPQGQNLYALEWTPLQPPLHPLSGRWALLGADGLGLTAALQEEGRSPATNYATIEELQSAIAAGAPKPQHIVRIVPAESNADPAVAAPEALSELLRELQSLTLDNVLAETRYVLVTQSAVAAGPTDAVRGFWQGGLWGLLRSVRSEHPDRRWLLLDTDAAPESSGALLRALWAVDEEEAALRQGERRAPRLVRAAPLPATSERVPWPAGTFLVTGGTRGLGAAVARHLAQRHRVRQLLLVSRQGSAAAGAAELVAELATLGCTATVAACDVADPQAVQRLLAQDATQPPLAGIIHCAGQLDDGVLSALTPQRIRSVFGAKALGAWNLHCATRHLSPAVFVVFSSAAGLLGNAGQASYAAANTFVDALCAYRRAQGLPAQSLAWGSWAQVGMAAQLSAAQKKRGSEQGVLPLEPDAGLELLDQALCRKEALLAPMRLDLGVLRNQAPTVDHSPLLRSLTGAKRAVPGQGTEIVASGIMQRLRELGAESRESEILAMVNREAAAVLQLPDRTMLRPEQPLRELGLDSLMALEVRNRLGTLVGQRLPSTLLFDYPTPLAVARWLHKELFPKQEEPPIPIFSELDKLESLLLRIAPDDGMRAGITSRLQAMMSRWVGAPSQADDSALADKLDSATPEELFALIDQTLGSGRGTP